MGTFKNSIERASRFCKVNFTEDEYAQLQRECRTRKLQTSPCIRAIVNDYLNTRLSRGETVLLEAVEELQANYLGVIQLQIDKQFSPASFADMAEQNRLRRRDLAHEFLLTVPASGDMPETEEDDSEDEDEGDE
ncbi:MAG: hypothetical protein ACJ74Z_16020 [Bryobacteraceae bacterium]|jgi:hypothetical protein